ncbi:MAG: linear amide C-N hydrolase [Chitinivibrionales bacterium]|nr:linear amide C-N hydrolase [Chitinivibrionales bacterium]
MKFWMVIVVLVISYGSRACTTFFLKEKGALIFGMNYDWLFGRGYLVQNNKCIAKTAFEQKNPAEWVSSYGSITFNQYGIDFPICGMNETGLAIGVMWHVISIYPFFADKRKEIDNMQWVQYQLDNCSSVDDVIATDQFLRVNPVSKAKVHYLVADAGGNCAAIEFFHGRMKVSRGDGLPVAVLTNSTYHRTAARLDKYASWGGSRPIPSGSGTQDRFMRTAHHLCRDDTGHTSALAKARFVLKQAEQPDYTKWSIAFDLIAGRIHFKTLHTKHYRSFDVPEAAFECGSGLLLADIAAPGDVLLSEAWRPYSRDLHVDLVKGSFFNTPLLRYMPMKFLQSTWEYPETHECRIQMQAEKSVHQTNPQH